MAPHRTSFEAICKDMPAGASFHQTADGWQLVISTQSVLGGCAYLAIFALWTFLGERWCLAYVRQEGLSDPTWIGVAILGGAVSLLFLWRALEYCGGRVVLSVAGNEARLFRGIYSLAAYQEVSWSDIEEIEVKRLPNHYSETSAKYLVLNGQPQNRAERRDRPALLSIRPRSRSLRIGRADV